MLTHIDQKNLPTMVDVADKKITSRFALARAQVQLPLAFQKYAKENEIYLKKGAVFQTAIIAGTMGVKKTHELIPFCHALPIESCKFDIEIDENLLVTIDCEVKTQAKTGVEMEAITGATVAALTIYDMCKALSHEIILKETKLLMKLGGKKVVLDRPLYALILTGGKSKRMQSDKALLSYYGKPHAEHLYELLTPYCEKVFISAKEKQRENSSLDKLPHLFDHPKFEIEGPLKGMLTAFEMYPEVNWLVVACDLVFLNNDTIETLLNHYRPGREVIAFKNSEKDFAEPLCTLYAPKAHPKFYQHYEQKVSCPVKVLKNMKVHILEQTQNINLANINTPEEKRKVENAEC